MKIPYDSSAPAHIIPPTNINPVMSRGSQYHFPLQVADSQGQSVIRITILAGENPLIVIINHHFGWWKSPFVSSFLSDDKVSTPPVPRQEPETGPWVESMAASLATALRTFSMMAQREAEELGTRLAMEEVVPRCARCWCCCCLKPAANHGKSPFRIR